MITHRGDPVVYDGNPGGGDGYTGNWPGFISTKNRSAEGNSVTYLEVNTTNGVTKTTNSSTSRELSYAFEYATYSTVVSPYEMVFRATASTESTRWDFTTTINDLSALTITKVSSTCRSTIAKQMSVTSQRGSRISLTFNSGVEYYEYGSYQIIVPDKTIRVPDSFHSVAFGTVYYADINEVLATFSTDDWIPITDCSTTTSFSATPSFKTISLKVTSRNPFSYQAPNTYSTSISGQFLTPPNWPWEILKAERIISTAVNYNRLPCEIWEGAYGTAILSFNSSVTFQSSSTIGSWHEETYSTEITNNLNPGREVLFYNRSAVVEVVGAEIAEDNGRKGFLIVGEAKFLSGPATSFSTGIRTSGPLYYKASAQITIPNWDHVGMGRVNLLAPVPIDTITIIQSSRNPWGVFISVSPPRYTTARVSFDSLGNCHSSWSWISQSSRLSSSGSMSFSTSESIPANVATASIAGGVPAIHGSYTHITPARGVLMTIGNGSSTSTSSTSYYSNASYRTTTMGEDLTVFSHIALVKGVGAIPLQWSCATFLQ